MSLEQAWQVACAYQQAGRRAEAETICHQLLGAVPGHGEVLNLLGVLAYEGGDLPRAGEWFRQAVAVRPGYVEALMNLGNTCQGVGRLDEAITAYRAALVVLPGNASIENNLGHAWQAQGQWDEAAACFTRAFTADPTLAVAHNNLAAVLFQLDRMEAARAHCERALALCPTGHGFQNNLGNVLLRLGLPREAERCLRTAHAQQPEDPNILTNLGDALVALGQLDAALACFREAVARAPANANAHCKLGATCLLRGEFAEGWSEYEWRWKVPQFQQLNRARAQPAWDGSPLPPGTTLWVHTEQGFGDTLQFVRYLPWIRARTPGVRLVLECAPALARFLSAQNPALADAVVSQSGTAHPPNGAGDAQVPLLSLPHVLGMPDPTATSWPTAYLHAAPARAASGALGSPEGLKVGFVWAGNPRHQNDRQRSLPTAALAPLRTVKGVQGCCWQIGTKTAGPPDPDWPDLGATLGDFADTASLLMRLDLLITVDTASAHLAGALGRPVWLLLPFAPDFRWLLGRADSPWYPTMRLFRQPQPGEWDTVVAQVARELEELVTRTRTPAMPQGSN